MPAVLSLIQSLSDAAPVAGRPANQLTTAVNLDEATNPSSLMNLPTLIAFLGLLAAIPSLVLLLAQWPVHRLASRTPAARVQTIRRIVAETQAFLDIILRGAPSEQMFGTWNPDAEWEGLRGRASDLVIDLQMTRGGQLLTRLASSLPFSGDSASFASLRLDVETFRSKTAEEAQRLLQQNGPNRSATPSTPADTERGPAVNQEDAELE